MGRIFACSDLHGCFDLWAQMRDFCDADDRIIFLGTGIDSDVANIITSQLMYLNSVDSESDIKMFINSPGGSCADGLAIFDVMNFVDADVSTYVMGTAASMGSILSSSGTKGKRYCLPCR